MMQNRNGVLKALNSLFFRPFNFLSKNFRFLFLFLCHKQSFLLSYLEQMSEDTFFKMGSPIGVNFDPEVIGTPM
jgi:hypothetical protein